MPEKSSKSLQSPGHICHIIGEEHPKSDSYPVPEQRIDTMITSRKNNDRKFQFLAEVTKADYRPDPKFDYEEFLKSQEERESQASCSSRDELSRDETEAPSIMDEASLDQNPGSSRDELPEEPVPEQDPEQKVEIERLELTDPPEIETPGAVHEHAEDDIEKSLNQELEAISTRLRQQSAPIAQLEDESPTEELISQISTIGEEHSRKEQSCPADFPTIVQSVSNSSLNDREEMGCTVTTEHRREEAAAEANTHLLAESSRLHVSSSACQLMPTPLLSRGPSPCLSEVGTSCQPPEHTIHPTIAVEEELEKKEKELHIAEPQYAHRCVDLDVTLDDDNGNGLSLQLPSTSDGEASAILEASVGLLEKSLRISDAKVTQLERLVQLQQQDIESLRFEIKWKDDRINNLQKELAKLEYLRPKPVSPAGDESQDE